MWAYLDVKFLINACVHIKLLYFGQIQTQIGNVFLTRRKLPTVASFIACRVEGDISVIELYFMSSIYSNHGTVRMYRSPMIDNTMMQLHVALWFSLFSCCGKYWWFCKKYSHYSLVIHTFIQDTVYYSVLLSYRSWNDDRIIHRWFS